MCHTQAPMAPHVHSRRQLVRLSSFLIFESRGPHSGHQACCGCLYPVMHLRPNAAYQHKKVEKRKLEIRTVCK